MEKTKTNRPLLFGFNNRRSIFFVTIPTLIFLYSCIVKADGVAITLNKLTPDETQCLASLEIENKLDQTLNVLMLKFYVWSVENMPIQAVRLDASPLTINKKITFELPLEVPCGTVAKLIIAKTKLCWTKMNKRTTCQSVILTQSRTAIELK